MTKTLSPADFRGELDDDDLARLAKECADDELNLCCAMRGHWGMLLQHRGITTDVLFDPDFDPVDYGLAKRVRPPPQLI